MKPRILFLCTGNSCRSQMAEGWAKHLLADKCETYSAGTEPQSLNQRAVQVMQECGIDISHHHAKSLESLSEVAFDLIVTVCDGAAQSCPKPPTGAKVIHAPFDDPPKLAKTAESDDEALQPYRRVRDEIKHFVENLPRSILANK